jgi:hypothetical protein
LRELSTATSRIRPLPSAPDRGRQNLSVLHTWGQNLQHHPHLHCIVPGGGLSPDGKRWMACKRGFFLAVRVLSRLFRRLFLEGIERLYAAGELQFFTGLGALKDADAFTKYLAPLRKTEWVLDATHVRFRWKDYRENGHHQHKVMRLDVAEFMRRFLLHVLPSGFHRIRHYGLFANGHRADKLALCRALLGVSLPTTKQSEHDDAEPPSPFDPPPCPCCGGRMIIIERFDGPLSRPYHVRRLDGL